MLSMKLLKIMKEKLKELTLNMTEDLTNTKLKSKESKVKSIVPTKILPTPLNS